MTLTPSLPCFIAALILTTAPTQADEVKSVPSGVNRQIDFFASLNPDCTTIGTATVRLIEGPDKGVITTDKGRDFMTFPRSNVRHVCNRRRVAGLKLFYQPQAGFFGTDRVRLLVVSGAGTEREVTYQIKVR